MLAAIPKEEELTALVGEPLYAVWRKLCASIEERYDMDRTWNKGGKAWTYEYKYRRGGKTLCALRLLPGRRKGSCLPPPVAGRRFILSELKIWKEYL